MVGLGETTGILLDETSLLCSSSSLSGVLALFRFLLLVSGHSGSLLDVTTTLAVSSTCSTGCCDSAVFSWG